MPPLDPLPTKPFGGDELHSFDAIFDESMSGQLVALNVLADGDFAMLSKTKSSPNIFNERQMKGKEWDEPKLMELNKLKELNAFIEVAADDPAIANFRPVDTMWAGRSKITASGEQDKLAARCVLRGDIHINSSRATT